MDYEQQAAEFAKAHGITLTLKGMELKKHFPSDKERRYVFTCTLKRNGKQFTFKFGQSIANGHKEPTMYDVLSCLQKYDPGTFENFCGDFGYDQWDKASKKVYERLVREWENMDRLFGDIMDELQEIQ